MAHVYMNPLIVLTVPHAKCNPNIHNHNCDLYAEKFADTLHAVLVKSNKHVITHHGNINRLETDLNRIEARYTEFRVNVRNTVVNQLKKFSMGNMSYVLDCHSFPNNRGYRNIRISNPDVMLLFDNTYNFIQIFELMELLRDNHIITILLPGSRNDIIDEFNIMTQQIQIISVLIEVNESISDIKLQTVCSTINNWITG